MFGIKGFAFGFNISLHLNSASMVSGELIESVYIYEKLSFSFSSHKIY